MVCVETNKKEKCHTSKFYISRHTIWNTRVTITTSKDLRSRAVSSKLEHKYATLKKDKSHQREHAITGTKFGQSLFA